MVSTIAAVRPQKPSRRRKPPARPDRHLRVYQSRMRRALAEELDPVVEAGTAGKVDATADFRAIRGKGETD